MSWIHIIWILLLGTSMFLYPSGASTDSVVLFGNLAKIFSLFVCGISLTLTQNKFKPEDSPERAWNFLAGGMWIWFFAQVIFGYYKLVAHTSPYPSLADVFFVIAYAPLLVGLIFLIMDFKSTGLPMGSSRSYMIQAAILLVVYAILFKTLLWDLLVNPNDSVTLKALNVGYPTLDFVLLALSSILVRIAWALRGGSLARSWVFLCAGFIALGVADIYFAYHALPVLDILYFSSYFMVALSGYYQLRMLRQ
jgi:hypothetical protein